MPEYDVFRLNTCAWLQENCPDSMGSALPDNEYVEGSNKRPSDNRDSYPWFERLIAKGWTTPNKELVHIPQIAEHGAFKQIQAYDGSVKMHKRPLQFAISDTATADSFAELGEHTVDVLSQLLGYDSATAQQLCNGGFAHQHAQAHQN